jgi:hydrogenase/urease accessory protein HupE
MSHCSHRAHHLTALVAALLGLALLPSAAQAHGFSSVVYVDVSAPATGQVRTVLALEYDLTVVSVADYQDDDPLYQVGQPAFDEGDTAGQAAALDAHADSVLAYASDRFEIAADGAPCTASQTGGVEMTVRDSVPYALLTLDWACPAAEAHTVTSRLFADDEGYVTGTTTIVTYDLDRRSGSAVLDAGSPTFSTHQSTGQRFVEFFLLGAEHLLTGLDHILFLLAIVAGSRRLREIVLAATTFTVAHSVTFILAATGLVHANADVVEPVIAASIAAVAAWHLVQIRRRGAAASELPGDRPFDLDRAGWLRLGLIFCFGLVHGLGFASALGLDEPWSWRLLWSLLVFNLGLEAVQLAIIAVTYPLLALLRRRSPQAAVWVTGSLAAAVAAMGLVWFVQRVS